MSAKTMALPEKGQSSPEQSLLKMILDNSLIHDCAIRDKYVMTVVLTYEQVEDISRYEAGGQSLKSCSSLAGQ